MKKWRPFNGTRVIIEKMDRISGLPKTILHDILSRLPEKDVVRTSVLSKAWRETWSTFPVLSICDRQIIRTLPQLDVKRKRMIFIDYVKKTLLGFYRQGLAIKEFKLMVQYFDLQDMSQDMDLWMKLVSESGVGVLELRLPFIGFEENNGGQDQCYTLRQGVLEAKSLNNVLLVGGIRIDKAFQNNSAKFFSLRVLSLNSVFLGDQMTIEHLVSHCPLIESITLNWCLVYDPLSERESTLLKSLSMHGVQRLNKVDAVGIQEVHIDAPNLESLCYCPGHSDVPYKLKFDSCRNLRCLCFESLSNIIADQWFVELFSKFPLLESLKLGDCSMSERITISSVRLKTLKLDNCFNLKEVKIDAPNLLSFLYFFIRVADKPVISFLRSSSQLKVNVKIVMEYLDLCSLRELIENFKTPKVLATLSLFIHQLPHVDEANLDILLVSSPPPSIKHLKLHGVAPINEALYMPLVNRLLSSCCPGTISFSLSCSRSFIKFFYETLMGRNQDDCYCSSGHTKCWWHGLKDVKVTSSVKNDENVDFKTILDAFSTSAKVEISFSLEL